VNSPSVSVLMPVYNAEATLHASICSALAQADCDFELIVVDDGSTDGSGQVIGSFRDPRIRAFSQANQGLAATLNRGLSLANGCYIARLDNDDLALPERLARQVAYMEAHPEVALLGTWAEIYEGDVPSGRFHRHPTESARLRLDLLFDNPFVHSSVMLRADAIRELGGYHVERASKFPEDYDLWSRVAAVHEIANLPEVLTVYREVPGSIMRTAGVEIMANVVSISSRNLRRVLPVDVSDAECLDLARLYHGVPADPGAAVGLRALALWRRAAVAVGGPPDGWSPQFSEGYLRARRHLISQIFRRTLPPAMLELLRRARRWFGRRS